MKPLITHARSGNPERVGIGILDYRAGSLRFVRMTWLPSEGVAGMVAGILMEQKDLHAIRDTQCQEDRLGVT